MFARRRLPGLANQIDWAIKRGELVSVLAGIYARPATATTLGIRSRAILAADARAIIGGLAAASWHGWPVELGERYQVISRVLVSRDWLQLQRRQVPNSMIRRVDGVRCTSRALTAVDLIPELGAEIVDEALRRRVPLAEMHQALAATPGRPGNTERRRVLAGSRDEPWSGAERIAHQALRAAGIRGWQANHAVHANQFDAPVAVLDVAFTKLKLAIEIDGAEYHANVPAFVRDRRRDELLARLGWQVVRFAATSVLADPAAFAAAVVELVRIRQRQLRPRIA